MSEPVPSVHTEVIITPFDYGKECQGMSDLIGTQVMMVRGEVPDDVEVSASHNFPVDGQDSAVRVVSRAAQEALVTVEPFAGGDRTLYDFREDDGRLVVSTHSREGRVTGLKVMRPDETGYEALSSLNMILFDFLDARTTQT